MRGKNIMEFKINGFTYRIVQVEQSKFWEGSRTTQEEDGGYFFGRSYFDKQEIWLDSESTEEQKRRTLYHELMHVYIRTHITNTDMQFEEEVLCDISANAHDIIHDIVERYFNNKVMLDS